MSAPRVVVSGVGCVGPWGLGLDGLASALAAGLPLARPIDGRPGYHARGASRLAALCPDTELREVLPGRQARRLGPASRLAVAAAKLASASAELTAADLEPSAVVLATAFGPASYTEKLLLELGEVGPELVSPFLFTDCVANAPAGQTAIALGCRGANLTVCQRTAGPLVALHRAAAEIGAGRAAVVLAGAVEEMTPLVHAILDRLRALARPSARGEEMPRPFDRRRDGFLAGEGATVFVLEAEAAARARGARLLATLRASGSANDPTASAAGWGDGHEHLAAQMRRSLSRAGVEREAIACVVSGASGAVGGDRLEALVLRRLFEDRLPPVVTPKAVTGEYGGGTLAPCLLALRGQRYARPAACTTPDSELGVWPAEGAFGGPCLVTAFAAGGGAAWAVLDTV